MGGRNGIPHWLFKVMIDTIHEKMRIFRSEDPICQRELVGAHY